MTRWLKATEAKAAAAPLPARKGCVGAAIMPQGLERLHTKCVPWCVQWLKILAGRCKVLSVVGPVYSTGTIAA